MVASINVNAQKISKFKDKRDGQHTIVKIGSQTWFAYNLNYITNDSWCYKDSSNENCRKRGRLYTLEVAKNASPDGWHLPSDAEWQKLEIFLGIPSNKLDEYGERGKYSNAGGKLKSKSLWKYPNKGASDLYGFNALPTGVGYGKGYFNGIGETTSFWTTTLDMGGPFEREFFYDTNTIKLNNATPTFFQSVRCIKD